MSGSEPQHPPSLCVPSEKKPQERSLPLYIVVLVDLVATCLVVTGLCTDRWVILSEAHGAVSNNIRLGLTSHFGAWKACRHDGVCGDPYHIVPGIDRQEIQWLQLLFGTTTGILILGFVLLCFKCWHLFFKRSHWAIDKFNRHVFGELLIFIATMLSITSILAMGQIKRKVILRHHQMEHAGYSFVMTLAGVLLVVFAVILLAFSSTSHTNSFLACDRPNQFLRRIYSLRTSKKTSTSPGEANTNPSRSQPQAAVTCITPANTAGTRSSIGVSNVNPGNTCASTSTRKGVVAADKSSDSQRSEDDFLLQNVRSLVGVDAYGSKQPTLSIQLELDGEGATSDYQEVEKTPSCVGKDSANDDVKADGVVVGSPSRHKSEYSPRSGVNRYPVGLTNTTPGARVQRRRDSADSGNKTSVLQTARRYAADAFARPFQASDQTERKSDDSCYPGDGGIAVLKYVDV